MTWAGPSGPVAAENPYQAAGRAAAAAASLHMTGDAAWRLLTGASYDRSQIWLTGDEALGEPLLRVRGVVIQAV